MAWSQVERGTLVVVMAFEDGPVAIAADSLAYNWNGNSQNVCKITTVGDKLVVAASGYTLHTTDGKVDFSALAVAHKVLKMFSKNQIARKSFGSTFATAWNKAFVGELNQQLRLRGSEITTYLPDDGLAATIVVGVDEKGLVTTWSTAIKYKKMGTRDVAFSQPVTATSKLPYQVPAGELEIDTEAYSGTTPRGRDWLHGLWEGSERLPSDQRSTYWARQLIYLTIDYLPAKTFGGHTFKTVGGPIDSVTIDRNGSIRWGEHKPECR
jgi:hypothetical protein